MGLTLSTSSLLFALFALTHPSFAEKASSDKKARFALVIGNSDYLYTSPLRNPSNDAVDMSTALKALGFQVTKKLNLNKNDMETTFVDFANSIQPNSIVVFFYAGHGIQINGENFLIPIDAQLLSVSGIEAELIRLGTIQNQLANKSATRVLFFDACRNNPWNRRLRQATGKRNLNVKRGLASVESTSGTLISFSTQPNNVALDGTGRNSPFTESLVEELSLKPSNVMKVLMNVRKKVMVATSNQQVPWENSALLQDLDFSIETKNPPSSLSDEKTTDVSDVEYWKSVKDSGDSALLKSYIQSYPQGLFAPLARSIISDLELEEKDNKNNSIYNKGNCNISGNKIDGQVTLNCK